MTWTLHLQGLKSGKLSLILYLAKDSNIANVSHRRNSKSIPDSPILVRHDETTILRPLFRNSHLEEKIIKYDILRL